MQEISERLIRWQDGYSKVHVYLYDHMTKRTTRIVGTSELEVYYSGLANLLTRSV